MITGGSILFCVPEPIINTHKKHITFAFQKCFEDIRFCVYKDFFLRKLKVPSHIFFLSQEYPFHPYITLKKKTFLKLWIEKETLKKVWKLLPCVPLTLRYLPPSPAFTKWTSNPSFSLFLCPILAHLSLPLRYSPLATHSFPVAIPLLPAVHRFTLLKQMEGWVKGRGVGGNLGGGVE